MEKCTLRFKKINYKYKEQDRPDSAIIQMNEKVLMVTNQHIFCIDRKKVLKNQVDILLCCAKSLQSCPTLCDPMDYSMPGFSVRGILQARILEWVATTFCRGSSQPRDWTCVLCLLHWQEGSLPLAPLGKILGVLSKCCKLTCLEARDKETLFSHHTSLHFLLLL